MSWLSPSPSDKPSKGEAPHTPTNPTGSPLASPYWLTEMKTLLPVWPLWGGCWFCYSPSGLAACSPHSALAGWVQVGPEVFSVVFAWSRTTFSTNFLSCWLPQSLALSLEGRLLKEIFNLFGLSSPSCSLQDLSSQHTDSLAGLTGLVSPWHMGSLAPRPGIKPVSPSLRGDFRWHYFGLYRFAGVSMLLSQLQIYIY